MYDTLTISIQGGQVCIERTAGMGRVPPHEFKSPAGDPEFEEACRLLRLEPQGKTERERQEDLRQMLSALSSTGGFEAAARRVGHALFDALLPSDGKARSLYDTCLESATRAGKGLRVVLAFGTTDGSEEQSLLALPWEYLYDPERGFYLGCSGDTLLTRHTVLPQAVRRFTTTLPLRVLIVICRPHDQHAFSREDAGRCVEQGLREASVAGEIQYRLLPQPTLEALAGELSAWKPQVLHFIGHGNFDEDTGGVLAFEDNYGGTDPVPADKLQKALRGAGLRLVFLTSCRSAETDRADDFAGVTQALVKGGIPAVVAMQFSVPVDSANIFDRAFYSALARHEAIDEAMGSARRVLFASEACVTPRDWGIPALYLQAESSVVARRTKAAAAEEASAVLPPPTNLERLHLPRTNLLGRGHDMVRVAKALREPGVRRKFVTLTGLGGIGKTALAIESAHWHLERAWFPEGVFWVNARDATLEGVLNDMAGALGVANFDTLDTPDKIAFLSRIHKERELFFVIDNADSLREDAGFRRFLEGLPFESRGRLLLTSRRAIGIDGERDVPLLSIEYGAAVGLFLYLWQVDEPTAEQLQQVAVICGRGMLEGHPLAITIAASLARKERNPDLSSLLKRLCESMVETLKDERTKEEEVSVEASLRLSWDALTDLEKALLARISVFRLPFREEAVAAVAAELGDWQPAMTNLLGHLVERRGDRYYLHPVVQDFAGNRLESPQETHRRAGEFLRQTEYLDEHLEAIDHLEIAQQWRSVIEGVSAMIDQLHREGHWGVAGLKLQQGLRAARELADGKSEGGMLCQLGSNHLRRSGLKEAIQYHGQALAIARTNGDRRGEGISLSGLGDDYFSVGDVWKAMDYYERALAVAAEIGDRHDEAAGLGGLGNGYARLGDVKKAIDYYEKALAICRDIGDAPGEEIHLGNLGNGCALLGELRKAIDYYEKALAIARDIRDRQGEGRALGNVGLAYASLGELRKATDYYEKALAIARDIGDGPSEGRHLGNLGLACFHLGEVRRAMEYYEKALAIARETGDRYSEGMHFGNLGLAYLHLGEVRKAIECNEQALAIARDTGDSHAEGNHLGNLANAYARLGEVKVAIDYYEKALAIAREIVDKQREGNHLGNLGNVYASLGEVKVAVHYYEKALAIAREIGDRQGEGNHLGNLGSVYASLGEVKKAIECLEEAERIFLAIGSPNVEIVRRTLEELRKPPDEGSTPVRPSE